MRWEVSCGADFLEDCSRILMNSQDGYQRLGHIENNSAYSQTLIQIYTVTNVVTDIP